jgi:hypothetical protein
MRFGRAPNDHLLLAKAESGGLALCVLGAAAYDIGRVFSVW